MPRTTTRVPVPTTNLKERIAALEQRNASKTPSASRPVSPPPLPGVVPSSSATSTAPGFRDKIAKFERKGGVPVPRGRFGLGAPPPNTHGPSRQGELYGNRIPAPARTVSVGSSIYPGTGSAAVSRAASPTFSNVGAGDRRSFSLSSVGDFESEVGGPDYTPIASPTFTFPPDSPETVLSPSISSEMGATPEVSPALNLDGEAANFVKPVVKARGTSFQKALEIARSAEQAKLAGGLASPESAGVTPTGTGESGVQSPVGGEERENGEFSGQRVEMESQLQVQQQEQSSTTELGLGQHTEVQAAPSGDSASPSPSPSPSTALPVPSLSSATASIPSPALTDDTVLSPSIVSPTTVVSPSVLSPSSSVLSPVSPQEQAPAQGVPMVVAPTIQVTPLTIRKRGLSLSQPSAEVATPSAEVPPLPISQTKEAKQEEKTTSKEDEARGTASLSSPGSELPSPSSLQSSPGVPPPRYSSLHHTFFMVKDGSEELPAATNDGIAAAAAAAGVNRTGSTSPESQRVRPLPQVPPPTASVGASPEGKAAEDDDIAPPSIVVSDTSARTPSRKNSSNLTINSSALKNASSSTLVVTDDSTVANNRASANSITEVLTTYFKGPATPPMSPAAKLAYDASPEASPGLVRRQTEPANLHLYASANANANATRPPVPAAINPPDPASFLSPPQTGLSVAPSSGGTSSIGSFSTLNSASRPYSMSLLEGSPTTQVHTALRMTPATSRGVPVFLPPVSASGMPGTGRVRKSDWGHFPPTPTGVAGGEGEGEGGEGVEGQREDGEQEGEAEFGSVVVTQHKGAKSMVDFSELGMTRAATVSGATRTQFTAVVHGKVREATVPLPSSSSSSSTTSATTSSARRNAVPQTPQQQKEGRRNKRDTILETPLSPGHGELAALLQEAMLLEDTLSRGTLPAEEADSSVLSTSQHSQGEKKKLETIRESEGQSKTKDEKEKEQKEKEKEERKRIAAAQAQLQAKRDEPTSGKLKHTFLIPLSKARSQHRKEVSAPASAGGAGGQTPTSAYPPVSARGETFPSSASVSVSGSTTSLHRLEEPQPPVPARPKSAGVQENGHGRTQSQSSKSRPVTPENQAVTPTPGVGTRQPQPQTPSKSPGSRFGSFSRRIGGAISGHGHNGGRPSTIHGASASAHTHTQAHGHGHGGRYSNSTSSEISSIDSQPVATPPEGMLEFGVVPLRAQHTGTSVRSAVPSVSVSEYGRNGFGNGMGTGMGNANGSQTSFPSLSPKKSASSLGRATSFAEKMWSRARTKSSGIDDSAPRLPALGPPPALELSSIPGMEKELPRVVNPPKRSTSLQRHNNDLPPIPTEPLPPLPVITSSAFDSSKPPSTPPKPTAKTPATSKSASTSQAPQLPQLPDVSISDISNDSLLTPGFTADSASRSSWTSMSSAGSLGSLPSPLFDKDLFDAFPSVPGTMPVPQPGDVFGGGIVAGRRETTIPMGAAAAAVAGHAPAGGKGPMPFDAALLSSAIHLQGRRSGETAR
ncbi:hypothetical protein CVT26_010504 [Gymnopilus dilepis]|uniref:Uncharacterized protein n=1 Tax=Gymnopilus dilepis TaxID=231916 RepID=A0A409Y0E5_9AGAR|nr:hypothetical protein CVT26_010504 [Gymnopilus dilepis]